MRFISSAANSQAMRSTIGSRPNANLKAGRDLGHSGRPEMRIRGIRGFLMVRCHYQFTSRSG
jgi:hypothetical protein